MPPPTRYARSGDASIAYQVLGDADLDLLLMPGWISHIDLLWEAPPYARFLERLAEFSRVISYDRRGTGLSDAAGKAFSLAQEREDALAVLDAVGSRKAALYAKWYGGPVAISLAVERQERVSALVLYAAMARTTWAPDYEWAMTLEQRDAFIEEVVAQWGETENPEIARWAPSIADDPILSAWFAQIGRSMATPAQARARWREFSDVDVREVLPDVEVPTLVMHRPRERVWDVRHSRYLAERVPGARSPSSRAPTRSSSSVTAMRWSVRSRSS
jgi:pimeloyl-ACP methyl ester carboxylesterase